MARWTTSDIPPQNGRSVVITGTGGLGFQDALALAHAGADVTIAGRNPAKGAAAVERIRAAVPNAHIQFEEVDLGQLDSVARCAERLRNSREKLDILINNAAVMTPPQRQTTADGFELQLGTNYLGHFALTAQLLPLLRHGSAPRVINLSSVAARQGTIDFDDLQAERNYRPMPVYAQSKLASLLFAFELQRRSTAAGWGITSIAAHPGISRTDLLTNAPGRRSMSGWMRTWLWFLFQPAAQARCRRCTRQHHLRRCQARIMAQTCSMKREDTPRYQKSQSKHATQRLPPAFGTWSEQLTGVHFVPADMIAESVRY